MAFEKKIMCIMRKDKEKKDDLCYMNVKKVNSKITSDRDECKKKTYRADYT